MSQPWIAKYRPKSLQDMVNQADELAKLKGFVHDFHSQKKKAMLLWGPPGTGKTASVHAVAHSLGLEIIEINASDFRNQDAVQGIVGHASRQLSLFSKGKVILVDEIDGLSGTKDRGGVQAIIAAIAGTAHPIVLTAEDPYDQKFSTLRSKCVLVEFPPLSPVDMAAKLRQICELEHIQYDEHAIKSLARRSGGDLRAAINDLQTLCHDHKLTKEDLETLSDREQTESVQEALLKIFKTTDPGLAISTLDKLDEDTDKLLLWIDENLPKEYKKPDDLARAYDCLSRSDVFKRRIQRQQQWRLLVYVNALITAGVAVSKDERYREPVDYVQTKRLLRIWMANQKYQKRKSIAQKLALATHTSVKAAVRDSLPYLQSAFKRDKAFANRLTEELDLGEDESEWLTK